jgi:uncharacterized SAM-binding protein YcdF (DUF218 family)
VQPRQDGREARRGAVSRGLGAAADLRGGLGAITRHLWQEAEADQFAAIAVRPWASRRERILVENRSTNTGENVQFTRQLLAEKGLDPRSFIVVQKPYMERRSYATFRKVWPEKAVVVTSPQESMDAYLSEYSHEALSPDDVVAIMVGDLQRIRCYPAKGFQITRTSPTTSGTPTKSSSKPVTTNT